MYGQRFAVYNLQMVGSKNPQSEPEERIDVRGDGRIILYKRAGLKNPKWQVRLRIPGANSYKIISSKSSKLGEAESFANNLYAELYHHVKSGGSIRTKTFTQIFADWENSVNLTSSFHVAGTKSGTVDRVRTYALKYFGSMKIDEITATDFQKFWLWRKENYSRISPSNNTLGRERTAILGLFRYAERHGHITKIPDFNPPKGKPERRPSFTEQEWTLILSKLDDWEAEGAKKSIARDRFIAKRYFLFLSKTGVRVGEARKLCWGDLRPLIKETGNLVVAEVRGKTGRRDVVVPKEIGKIFNEMYSLHCDDLKKLHPTEQKKWSPHRNRLFFCHPDGTPIKTFKRSFHSLLSFANVPVDRHGKPRTIYSLRHVYATDRLYASVPAFTLARNMGTSVEMLEKFYGHIINTLAADEITQTRFMGNTKSIMETFKS